jgi:hypothetical protein
MAGQTDDGKNAKAILKLAEAQRRFMALVEAYLIMPDGDEELVAAIRALLDSAEHDARSVDNGALRDYEVTP